MTAAYERALLGQVLHAPALIDHHGITESLFITPDYRIIFGAVEVARNEFESVDSMAVGDVLQRKGRGDLLATMAGLEYVSTANAGYYAGQLREQQRRKGLADALKQGAEALKDATKPSTELADSIMGAITSSIQQAQEPEAPTMKNIILPYIETVEARIKERREGIRKLAQFGLYSLDELVNEIRPGEVVVIAGRPGAGKTALALQLLRYSSVANKKPAAFFSMEMRRDEVLDRLVAQSGAASVSALRGGYVSNNEVDGVKEETARLYQAPLSIYDGAQSLASIRSRIRREVAVHGLKIACIDYLGLIDTGSNSKTPRWERIGEVSRSFKLLALELGIVIVEVVQMNREADGMEPTLGVLRDSGAIEQDADRIIMLHTKEQETQGLRQVTAIVGKNRHGATGRVSLMFDGAHVLFSEEKTVGEL